MISTVLDVIIATNSPHLQRPTKVNSVLSAWSGWARITLAYRETIHPRFEVQQAICTCSVWDLIGDLSNLWISLTNKIIQYVIKTNGINTDTGFLIKWHH